MKTYYILVNDVLYTTKTKDQFTAIVKVLKKYYKDSPYTIEMIKECKDMADIYQMDFDMQYWSKVKVL